YRCRCRGGRWGICSRIRTRIRTRRVQAVQPIRYTSFSGIKPLEQHDKRPNDEPQNDRVEITAFERKPGKPPPEISRGYTHPECRAVIEPRAERVFQMPVILQKSWSAQKLQRPQASVTK